MQITAIKTQLGWFVGKVAESIPNPDRPASGVRPPLILLDPAFLQEMFFPIQQSRLQPGMTTGVISTSALYVLPFSSLTIRTEGPFAVTDLTSEDQLFKMYNDAITEYKKHQKKGTLHA